MFFFDIIDIILLSALSFFFLIQLIYYWVFLGKPYYYQKSVEKGVIHLESSQPPVSIIVCAKNQSQNLEDYFPSILEQNYPVYEVIFVDDDSSDDTDGVLKRLSCKYQHFYHTYIPAGSKNLSRKKLGLTLGVKAAKYDTLLFTEADSHPVSADWISRMARHFTSKRTIVLGFSSLGKSVTAYAAYDYFLSNLQMISLALKGLPYIGNGRNMAYSKEHFIQQRGFLNSNFLDAGEDDLFIKDIVTKDNVAIELSPESVIDVNLDGKVAWRELKRRRMLTAKFYKKFPRFFWRFEVMSRICFFLLFFFCIIWSLHNYIFLGIVSFLFLFRLFTQLFVINKTASRLALRKFYFTLPLFDFIQPFVNGYFYLCRIFTGRNSYNWKYEKR